MVKDSLEIFLIITGLLGCGFAAGIAFFYILGATSKHWKNLDEEETD